ncbi:MAG TPA: tetratricopeptide repeat protein [Pantanalinema sp.]
MLKPLITAVALAALTFAAPAAWAVDTSRAELEELQRRVDLDPKSPDVHFDLAMGLARTVKLESGYASLKKVIELDPTYADKVIATYKPLVDQNKQNVEAFFRLAFGYYFKGWSLQQADPASAEGAQSKQLARTAFEAIIANDPKYVWGYNYLGYLIAESGDLEKAVGLWRQAISVEDNAVAHFLIGQAYMRQGKMAEGVMETATAMRMRGLNP